MQKKEKQKQKTNFGKIIRYTMGVIFGFIALSYIYALLMPPITPRPKQFCSRAEFDAQTIAATLSDYFSDPAHQDVTPDQLRAYEPLLADIKNPWTFTYSEGDLVIMVTDRTGRCPRQGQQSDSRDDSALRTTYTWDANVLTMHIQWEYP